MTTNKPPIYKNRTSTRRPRRSIKAVCERLKTAMPSKYHTTLDGFIKQSFWKAPEQYSAIFGDMVSWLMRIIGAPSLEWEWKAHHIMQDTE